MPLGYDDLEPIIGVIDTFWSVLYIIFDAVLIKFLELVVAYLEGELIDNVIFMTFFFIIISTALILALKFMK